MSSTKRKRKRDGQKVDEGMKAEIIKEEEMKEKIIKEEEEMKEEMIKEDEEMKEKNIKEEVEMKGLRGDAEMLVREGKIAKRRREQ